MQDPIYFRCHNCLYYFPNTPFSITIKRAIENPELVDTPTLYTLGISPEKPGCTNSFGKKGPCPKEISPLENIIFIIPNK